MQAIPPRMIAVYVIRLGRNAVASRNDRPINIATNAEYKIERYAAIKANFYERLLFFSIFFYKAGSEGRQNNPILVSDYLDAYIET